MYLVNFSKRASDFIDAADDNGNIRKNRNILNYVRLCDNAIKEANIEAGAVYLFAGDDTGNLAHSYKFNFLDPRDSNDAFRLSFGGGGWAFSNNGIAGNGTSSYANTYYIPSVQIVDDSFILWYSNTPNATLPNACEIGSRLLVDSVALGTTTLSSQRSTGNYFGSINLTVGNLNQPVPSGKGLFTHYTTDYGAIQNMLYNNYLHYTASSIELGKSANPIFLGARSWTGWNNSSTLQIENNSQSDRQLSIVILGSNAITGTKVKQLQHNILVALRSIGRGI